MTKQWRALLVDDERLARQDMKSLLSEHPEIQIVAEADSVQTAVSLIDQHHPDLLFLDIQMPGESGFDLLNKIDYDGHIVFVTAYDEHAIRAFDMNALDYLLKPVHPQRLKQALDRLGQKTVEPSHRPLEPDDRLFLMVDRRICFIEVQTITCITANRDYTSIRTSTDIEGLTNKTMKEWEERLPPKYFARIHRSSLVNLDFIDRIEKWFNDGYQVYLKNEATPLLMSRRYASKVKERYG